MKESSYLLESYREILDKLESGLADDARQLMEELIAHERCFINLGGYDGCSRDQQNGMPAHVQDELYRYVDEQC